MKQAVVLIHGIGEQVPMETLCGFVDAVWTTDPRSHNPYVPAQQWSKPDQVSGDFELRRLTTSENRDGKRTDFFEFYWAHMMEGTEISHLIAWGSQLVFRSPKRVPAQLRGLWWFLVLATLAVAGWIAAFWAYEDRAGWVKTALSAAGSLFWLLIGGFIVKISGRMYLSAWFADPRHLGLPRSRLRQHGCGCLYSARLLVEARCHHRSG